MMVTFPDGDMIGDLKIGNPYHGLWRSGDLRLDDGTLTLDLNGQTIPYRDINGITARADQRCMSRLVQVPGLPVPQQTNQEAAMNMEWRNYALQSGGLLCAGGVPISGVSSDAAGDSTAFIYIDSARQCWLVTAHIPHLNPGGNTITVRRFGLIDGTTHVATSFTAPYTGSVDTVAGNQRSLVAKTKTGHKTVWATIADDTREVQPSDAAKSRYVQHQPSRGFWVEMVISGVGDEGQAQYGLTFQITQISSAVGTKRSIDYRAGETTITDFREVITSTTVNGGLRKDSTMEYHNSVVTGTEGYDSTMIISTEYVATVWAFYDDADALKLVKLRSKYAAETTKVKTGGGPSVVSPGWYQASPPSSQAVGWSVSDSVTTTTEVVSGTVAVLFDDAEVFGTSAQISNSTDVYGAGLSASWVPYDADGTKYHPSGSYLSDWPTYSSYPPTDIDTTVPYDAQTEALINLTDTGSKKLAVAVHRFSPDIIGVLQYERHGVSTYEYKNAKIIRLITSDGAVTCDYPVEVGYVPTPSPGDVRNTIGLFAAVHPVTKQVATDEVPLCWI